MFKCEVSWRRRNEWRPNTWRRFVRIGVKVSISFYCLHLQFVVNASTLKVATLGVGCPTSCPMVFRRPSSLKMASLVGITTIGAPMFGVGFVTINANVARLLLTLLAFRNRRREARLVSLPFRFLADIFHVLLYLPCMPQDPSTSTSLTLFKNKHIKHAYLRD